MQRLSSSEKVVLLTLAYCDQFDFPLMLPEIFERTPQHNWASLSELKKTISTLKQKEKIVEKEKCFCLSGREIVFSHRERRAKIAQQKWNDVVRFVNITLRVPWIQAVFLTGSLAMKNSEEDDDVDFLLVVLPHTLWISRMAVTFFALLLGKRRSWQGEEKQSWCLNLWLDTDHLKIEPSQQNIYTAYEVIQAQPIFDRENTVNLFYQRNTWVKKFLPQWSGESEFYREERDLKGSVKNRATYIVRLADWLAWKFQMAYMKPHRTSERVGRGYAFFHPRDTKGIIFKKWKKSLEFFKISLPPDTI